MWKPYQGGGELGGGMESSNVLYQPKSPMPTSIIPIMTRASPFFIIRSTSNYVLSQLHEPNPL